MIIWDPFRKINLGERYMKSIVKKKNTLGPYSIGQVVLAILLLIIQYSAFVDTKVILYLKGLMKTNMAANSTIPRQVNEVGLLTRITNFVLRLKFRNKKELDCAKVHAHKKN